MDYPKQRVNSLKMGYIWRRADLSSILEFVCLPSISRMKIPCIIIRLRHLTAFSGIAYTDPSPNNAMAASLIAAKVYLDCCARLLRENSNPPIAVLEKWLCAAALHVK